MKIQSPKFKIDKIGLQKVGKGLLIGIGGLILTGLEQAIPFINVGEWNPIVLTINSVIVNALRKILVTY